MQSSGFEIDDTTRAHLPLFHNQIAPSISSLFGRSLQRESQLGLVVFSRVKINGTLPDFSSGGVHYISHLDVHLIVCWREASRFIIKVDMMSLVVLSSTFFLAVLSGEI